MTTQLAIRFVDERAFAPAVRPDATPLAAEIPADQPWISGFALCPRHLNDGDWVWLRPFEWRWERAAIAAPLSLRKPRVQSRSASRPPERRHPTHLHQTSRRA